MIFDVLLCKMYRCCKEEKCKRIFLFDIMNTIFLDSSSTIHMGHKALGKKKTRGIHVLC